ncbi:MAG: GGDEF domain-containing protein [Bacillota bacterium]
MDKNFNEELFSIIEKLNLIEKMYHVARLVDPVRKRVIGYRKSALDELESECYNMWKRGKICENCISMRSYMENETFVKMEYLPDKVYLLTAIPVVVHDKKFVVEMMKDVTNSMVLDTGIEGKIIEIQYLIDNLNRAAVEDSLTKVYNKRFINERIPIQIIKSKLNNEPLSIIFADIDHFKQLNDTYGHLAGDCVLKGFADEFVKSIRREKDWIARYGGEEFLMCLPNADLSTAYEVAERIRENIENKVFDYQGVHIRITASFGVCSIDELDDFTMDALLEIADKKLYQAKGMGRNKVIM